MTVYKVGELVGRFDSDDLCVELSQDVASKGLGLVYELGGEQDQQELVSTLVETLMTGKRYLKKLLISGSFNYYLLLDYGFW